MLKFIENLLVLRLTYLERRNNIRRNEIDILREAKEVELETIEEQLVCQTCEVLKMELARAHDQNQRLIEIITAKPEPETKISIENLKPILPTRHMPFHVRRQMLEQEDRAKARVIQAQKEALKENVVDESLTSKLEQELDIVATEREAESGVRKEVE